MVPGDKPVMLRCFMKSAGTHAIAVGFALMGVLLFVVFDKAQAITPQAQDVTPALQTMLKTPEVTAETAIALGNLKRRGMAVSVVLVMDDDGLERAHARLVAEGIRDLRHCGSEEMLPELCSSSVQRLAPYDFATPGA